MNYLKNKGFDEIILDHELDLSDPDVFYTLSKYYETGEGVEQHQALADFFKRVGESLEKREVATVLDNKKMNEEVSFGDDVFENSLEIDSFDTEEGLEEENFELPHLIDTPFNDEANLDIDFYQAKHENTKQKLIEEAKAKYQDEVKELLGEGDSGEIELVLDKEDDIKTLSAEETYEKAIELIESDNYDEALSMLKTIGDMDDVSEETLAKTLFVLALAYPNEEYPKYATQIAWKNRDKDYARNFLEYFYSHDCGELYLNELDGNQLAYLGKVIEKMEDNNTLDFSLDIPEEDDKEDTGSTSILHETAKLEKLILEDDNEFDAGEQLAQLKKMID